MSYEDRQQRQREMDRRAEGWRVSIRAHLDKRGLSQKEACDLACLNNASALGNFLSGRTRDLGLEIVIPLARALNLTIDQFIGRSGNE